MESFLYALLYLTSIIIFKVTYNFPKTLILFFFMSCLLLTGFWFLLVDGELDSLLVGVFFIPMSIFVAIKLSAKTDNGARGFHVKLMKVPKFIVFFLYQSVKGGTDTARRVFSLNMKLQPEFVHYSIKLLPVGLPINLFMNVVSLLPGSVSVIRAPDGVLVHVLTVTNSTVAELYQCECMVSELFGLKQAEKLSDSSTERVN